MSSGLKRVAKQCGGLSVHGLDGKIVNYDANGEAEPARQKKAGPANNVGALIPQAAGASSVKSYDETLVSETPEPRDPKTLVHVSSPYELLLNFWKRDEVFQVTPLGGRIREVLRRANEGLTFTRSPFCD